MPFSETPPRLVSHVRELNVGDVLLRRKSAVMHIGVYVGDNQVFDNAPGRGESLVSFDLFAKRNAVFAIPTGRPPEEVSAQVQKILENPQRYHLLKQNCEHSVRRLLGSEMVSMQLKEVEDWALIGAAFGKGMGKRGMWAGAFLGALAGTLSLPRMQWLKRRH